MKFDKEAMAKNGFWIGLGGFTLVWLIAFLTIKMAAGSTAAGLRKKYDDQKKQIESKASSRPKNEKTYTEPWRKYADDYAAIKKEVWQKAWELQNPPGHPFVTWPKSPTDEKQVEELLKYPDADVKDEAINRYLRQYQQTLYAEQFKLAEGDGTMVSLETLVAPIEFKNGSAGFKQMMAPTTGGTSVALGGDRPKGAFIPPGAGRDDAAGGRDITNFWGSDRKVPTLEEAYLAQEDFWVKREMLEIIKAALESAGRMPVLKDKKDDKDTGFHKVGDKGDRIEATFRNTTWELHLVLEKQRDASSGNINWVIGKDSTIKNVSASKRMLDLKKGAIFRLRQGNAVDRFTFDGELQPWNAEPARLGKVITKIDKVQLNEPFEVEQVFDWDSSPIKRIDELRVAYNSHRTANVPLKPGLAFPVQNKDAGANPNPAAPGPGAPGPGAPSPGPARDGRPGVPGPGADAPATAATPTDVTEKNGVLRNRYLHVTKECRHLPIAMTVVVDQAHLHNVLAAVANSRLRIQTTQIQFQQASGVTSQADKDKDTPPPASGDDRPRPGGPGDKFRPGTGTAPEVSEDPNLIELTVYGIASIYERFPPKPKPPAEGDKNAPPGDKNVPPPNVKKTA